MAKAIKSDFKIAMTGTPVENSLVDLWCIMDFAVPGLLGNAREFAKDYQTPLKKASTDVSKIGEMLRKRIGVFLKRRLKLDVAKDLPEKKIIIEKIFMPEEQETRYKTAVMEAQNISYDGKERGAQILKYIHLVRNISDHPFLPDKKIESYSAKELVDSSAKLQATIEILNKIKVKQEKVIIFAEKKEVQKMLQNVVYSCFNIIPKIINGDTPSSVQNAGKSKLTRQQCVENFQMEPGFNVIIMSQLAAGVGLNVVGANHVIHYSRHWNPAKEEQATDRVYRIGQWKDVFVYYPMAVLRDVKTFDIVLNELLERKKTLAANTLFPTEQSEISPDELFSNIFENSPNVDVNIAPFNFAEITKLTPLYFEAFVAALYEKMGSKVILTPSSNDKGADVVVFGDEKNILIQCKQSLNPIDNKAIQEIVGARGYYRLKYGVEFELLIITNSCLNENAKEYAVCNFVEFYEGKEIKALLAKSPLTISDVNKMEYRRELRI